LRYVSRVREDGYDNSEVAEKPKCKQDEEDYEYGDGSFRSFRTKIGGFQEVVCWCYVSLLLNSTLE